MLKRTVTGVIIAAGMYLTLYFSFVPGVLLCASCIFAAFSAYELCHGAGHAENEWLVTVSILMAVGLSCWDVWHYKELLLVVFPAAVVYFSVLMCRYRRASMKNPLKVLALVLVISLLYRAIPVLRGLNNGLFYLTGGITLCFVTDVAAFMIGKRFGKHKLIVPISPNKTVEGSVAGVVFAVLIMLLLGGCLDRANIIQIHYPRLVLYSALAAVVGEFGDLAMSAVKRACGIKDFGNIFPGHGGMLDRFDSHIFAIPFTLIFCWLTGGYIL